MTTHYMCIYAHTMRLLSRVAANWHFKNFAQHEILMKLFWISRNFVKIRLLIFVKFVQNSQSISRNFRKNDEIFTHKLKNLKFKGRRTFLVENVICNALIHTSVKFQGLSDEWWGVRGEWWVVSDEGWMMGVSGEYWGVSDEGWVMRVLVMSDDG